jgi:hypothetical protein
MMASKRGSNDDRTFPAPSYRHSTVSQIRQDGRRNKIVQQSARAGVWCFVILTQPQLLVAVRAGA